jgi:hypothetical protein
MTSTLRASAGRTEHALLLSLGGASETAVAAHAAFRAKEQRHDGHGRAAPCRPTQNSPDVRYNAAVNTFVSVLCVVLGAAGLLGFRQITDWFDRVLRTLADGPGTPEPQERGVFGQWLMVGTGSSVTARWWRYAATLVTSVGFLVAGAGCLAGAWQLVP